MNEAGLKTLWFLYNYKTFGPVKPGLGMEELAIATEAIMPVLDF